MAKHRRSGLAKGPRSFRATKVKGHATCDMVDQGLVKSEDKQGNDISDKAADKGAEQTDVIAAAFGYVYAKRHKHYIAFMEMVQRFIITIRKAEDEKRKKKQKEEDPFRNSGEATKMKIPISLKFGEE